MTTTEKSEKTPPENAVAELAISIGKYDVAIHRLVAGKNNDQAIAILEDMMNDPIVIRNDKMIGRYLDYWIHAVRRTTSYDHAHPVQDRQAEMDRLRRIRLEAYRRLHSMFTATVTRFAGQEVEHANAGNLTSRMLLISEIVGELCHFSPSSEKAIRGYWQYVLAHIATHQTGDFEKMAREVLDGIPLETTRILIEETSQETIRNTRLQELMIRFLFSKMTRHLPMKKMVLASGINYWLTYASPAAMERIRAEADHFGRLSIAAEQLRKKLAESSMLLRKEVTVTCTARDTLLINGAIDPVAITPDLAKSKRDKIVAEKLNEITGVITGWRGSWNLYFERTTVGLKLFVPPLRTEEHGHLIERKF